MTTMRKNKTQVAEGDVDLDKRGRGRSAYPKKGSREATISLQAGRFASRRNSPFTAARHFRKPAMSTDNTGPDMSTSNTAPDWSQVKLSDRYDWSDGVSTNGTPFKIGTRKSDSPAPPQDQVGDLQLSAVEINSKSDFDIQVYWQGRPPPDGFTPFNQPTAEETQITSITSWVLNTAPLDFNEFEFTCTESYNFHFYDATGDSYQCNVFWPRSSTVHVIWYFSSNPTIVRITGS